MAGILIKNAFVIDPISGIKGEVMDIAINKGKIVEEAPPGSEIIDAAGCLTLPGGIDSHSHVCGTKVNFGRYMSPEDMRAGRTARKGVMHVTSGYSVPTTFGNSYRYSTMGYTTILEGAMAPLEARHTHEEFTATPHQDMLANTLFDGNWSIMEAVQEKDTRRAAAVVAWVLAAAKGFAIKLTNPGGTEAWGWGEDVHSVHDPVPKFGVTPAEIISTMIRANELLNLPHSVHLHCNNLGVPGNYQTTLDTIELAPDLNRERQSLYLTHVQFHSYGGSTWRDICSKSEDITRAVNNRPQVVMDMGQIMFGRTTTMTADGPMEFKLYMLHHNKWSNHDVELETGSGIIPVYYGRKSLVNCVMWSIGLELALLTRNPWQCLLSTDSPNGAPFVKYPEIIALLMSRRLRENERRMIDPRTEHFVPLFAIERELDWYEIAVMTRAAQAKALGITRIGKGYLAPGAEADVAIFSIRPDQVDPSVDYQQVMAGFSRTRYTIKRGRIVARDGEVVVEGANSTIWTKAIVPDAYDMSLDPEFRKKFEQYYTVRMSNYPVQDVYLPRGVRIETEAQL
ncbi:MAG: dihydroorotase [Methanoregulaceae archaeon PtaB.Bin056]|jgi:formylmethanofuran dehydrogenase subunit A|nr:MAG: dihydroorotase [Methanoregulaceae archaeon PtaB.Bin056]